MDDHIYTIPQSSDKMYKCKKAITLPNFKQRVCKWKGALDEYIQHVKVDHTECYFIIQKEQQKFQWKLPYLGDQIDLGIFEHQLGHFLYEIYYKEDVGKLWFSLAYIGELPLATNIRYKLQLCNENEQQSFECATNVELEQILKPIQEQEHVFINKDVIMKYTDQARVFQWIVIITNEVQ